MAATTTIAGSSTTPAHEIGFRFGITSSAAPIIKKMSPVETRGSATKATYFAVMWLSSSHIHATSGQTMAATPVTAHTGLDVALSTSARTKPRNANTAIPTDTHFTLVGQ